MQYFSGSAPAPGMDGSFAGPSTPRLGPSIAPVRKSEPPPRRVAWLRWLITLAAILAVAAYWAYRSESTTSAKGRGVTVPVAVLSMGDIASTVRISGTVAAMNSASLLAPRILGSRTGINRGGTATGGAPGAAGNGDFTLVLLSLAKPGTHVKAGDVVGQFDPQSQLQRLEDYKDSVVQLENSIKNMTANLAAVKEAHDQSVRTAKANWDKAVLDLQTAPVHAQIDVEKLKLAAEEAEATYKQLVFEASLVEESQKSQIRISELNRDQSRIELQRAQTNVDKMTFKSPMEGTIVMASIVRNGEFGQVREGDQVNAGQPFVSIVDPSSMVLDASVNQIDAERLRLGMKARVRVDAYPEVELPGEVTGIGAMSKTSTFREQYVGEIPIRIKIDRSDPRLIPELTGSAEVVVNSETGTVVAPRSAVAAENGHSFVFVKDGEIWSKHEVEVGLESFTKIAIHSGVRSGDTIAVEPATVAQALK